MPGHSSLSFLGEVGDAFFRLDRHGERDQMESPSNGLVPTPQRRFMISGDNELELRPVLEKVLPHEPGRNSVAAGKLLDPTFGPASALFCFGRSDKASAPKAGEVRRVTIAVAGGESFDRSRTMIFTQNSGDGRKQDALTVRSSAVSEEKRVLTREARQSVAEDPLGIGMRSLSPPAMRLRKVRNRGQPPRGPTAVIFVK